MMDEKKKLMHDLDVTLQKTKVYLDRLKTEAPESAAVIARLEQQHADLQARQHQLAADLSRPETGGGNLLDEILYVLNRGVTQLRREAEHVLSKPK